MMQAIRKFIPLFALLFLVQANASQTTDPECLNHLGGGQGDVECYGGLTNMVVADSKSTYLKIFKTIPKNNPNSTRLKAYATAQDHDTQFCKLKMQAPSGWVSDSSAPLLNMYDAVYAECVYDLRKSENKFLHDVLDSINK
ncbi:hypothetical protein [Paraburkholderia bryophila]|uniref:Lysozyme inhibitor LprI N-terminal domain-containing protein n=1 Tax=Paraburkholderia bryophila TaxID=420952 RepID=A0A7Y9W382_9BURK|nr:hypothetical protein [Paraburkholderia bryophila]NYH12886.1 hypothetical protein [Paraburkholderia bryophila]